MPAAMGSMGAKAQAARAVDPPPAWTPCVCARPGARASGAFPAGLGGRAGGLAARHDAPRGTTRAADVSARSVARRELRVEP